MTRHWLVMETAGEGTPAPFVARLAGAGRQLPETHLTTDELMATTRHRTHIDLERLTGIRERRVSVGDEDSYSLAISAALNCPRHRATGSRSRSMWSSAAASRNSTAASPNGWSRR